MQAYENQPICVVAASKIPASKNGRALGGRPPTDLEIILEALFYRLRVAGPWRDLDEKFGPWRTIYGWHRQWSRDGLWIKMLSIMAKGAKSKVRLIDGSHIPVHQCAANPKGGGAAQAMGKTKGGRNTKLMAMTDVKGRVVALLLVPGQAYEGHFVVELLTAEGTSRSLIIVGDKAYDDDKLRAALEAMLHETCFAARSNRLEKRPMHKGFYRKRFRIENMFGRLKRWGCTATRRDKLAAHFLSLVAFASVIDWLRS